MPGSRLTSAGQAYAAPSVTPTANAVVLASFATTKIVDGFNTTWTPPSAMTRAPTR